MIIEFINQFTAMRLILSSSFPNVLSLRITYLRAANLAELTQRNLATLATISMNTTSTRNRHNCSDSEKNGRLDEASRALQILAYTSSLLHAIATCSPVLSFEPGIVNKLLTTSDCFERIYIVVSPDLA